MRTSLALGLTAGIPTLLISAMTHAVVVDYTTSVGTGSNTNPLNGLSAHGEFTIDGNTLTVVLENTSSDVPSGATVADSLLVSLAFDLDGLSIAAGNSALISDGSAGLGAWAGLSGGADVGDQWLWSNEGGGNYLTIFDQIITTSTGQGMGLTTSFNGAINPIVEGPFGGMAANPALMAVPDTQMAVSSSIVFSLTLSGTLTETELEQIAGSSVVEFGSDFEYLAVPAPASAALLLIGLAGARRRRR